MNEEIDVNEYNQLDGLDWGFPEPYNEDLIIPL